MEAREESRQKTPGENLSHHPPMEGEREEREGEEKEGGREKGRKERESQDFKQIKRKGRGDGRSTSIMLTLTLARELNSCLELFELFAPQTIEQPGLCSV